MSKREIKLYITDILESAKKIKKYTRGMTLSDFKKDEKTADAVIRNLEIIGEAAYKMPDGFRKKNKTVPWTDVADMRHKLAHEYFGIDMEIVWKTIQEDLPELAKNIKNLNL